MKFKSVHLDLKEFVKFGYQCKVVPVLTTSDELMHIFKVVCKFNQASLKAEDKPVNLKNQMSQSIDYNAFK